MPETPTPGVNGHEMSLPALQASTSISSLAPATTMFGESGLMATPGSFCLLLGNGVGGLPAVTRAADCAAASGNANDAIPSANAATMTPVRFMFPPPLNEGFYSLFTRTAGVLT